MTELQRILASLTQPGVLATVVNVEGSAYRRPGARMFVPQNGESIGTISGGCLESDVIERGWALTENDCPALIRYDSRGEDDLADWGFGLGCNGAIDVLLERIDLENPPEYLEELSRALRESRSVVLATVFSHTEGTGVKIGTRFVLDQPYGLDHRPDEPVLETIAREAWLSRSSSVQNVTMGAGSARVFFEWIDPPPRLLVCGAGHDAVPLVRLAKVTGWSITVCDRRESLATAERFPEADAVHATPPEQLLDLMRDPPDAVVIMTHRFPEDLKYLSLLLDLPAAYIGVLGPRHRTDRLLKAAKIDSPPPQLHAPVGLDLGGETPEEIALAILAEATAVLCGRSGGKLRESHRPIHGQPIHEQPIHRKIEDCESLIADSKQTPLAIGF